MAENSRHNRLRQQQYKQQQPRRRQHNKTPLNRLNEKKFFMSRARYARNYITEWKGTHDSNSKWKQQQQQQPETVEP